MLNRIGIAIGLCGLTVVMGVGLSFAHEQFMPRPERIAAITHDYTGTAALSAVHMSADSATAQPVVAQLITGQSAATAPAINALPVVNNQPEPLAGQVPQTTAFTPMANVESGTDLSFHNAAPLDDPIRPPARPAAVKAKQYDLATLGTSSTAPVLFDSSFSTSQSYTRDTQQVTPTERTAAQTYPKSLKNRTMIGVYR